MKLGTLLGDVVRALFQRPATRRYPAERPAVTPLLRGALRWNPEKCTGCALCVKDCPSEAIELITLDKAKKRFVMRYYADRCTFCAQCVQNCRFNCLALLPEAWELAAADKAAFTHYYGEPSDVNTVLAARAARDPEPA